MGIKHAHRGCRHAHANLPSGTKHFRLSLPTQSQQPFGWGVRDHRLWAGESGRVCLSARVGGAGGQRHLRRLDANLLPGIRTANRPCLEPLMERWRAGEDYGRARDDEHPNGVGAFLQSDRTARARAIQRRTPLRRERLPFRDPLQYSLCGSKRFDLAESIQWNIESDSRSAGRLVLIPADPDVWGASTQYPPAVCGSI